MAPNTTGVAVSAEALAWIMPELTRSGVLMTSPQSEEQILDTYLEKTKDKGRTTTTKNTTTKSTATNDTNHLQWGFSPKPTTNHVGDAGEENFWLTEDQTQQSSHGSQRGAPDAVGKCAHCGGGRGQASTKVTDLTARIEGLNFMMDSSLGHLADQIAHERAQLTAHLGKISDLLKEVDKIQQQAGIITGQIKEWK